MIKKKIINDTNIVIWFCILCTLNHVAVWINYDLRSDWELYKLTIGNFLFYLWDWLTYYRVRIDHKTFIFPNTETVLQIYALYKLL